MRITHSNNWESLRDGRQKRRCTKCDGNAFAIYRRERPKKGTTGYQVKCLGCGKELSLSPRPQEH
jgi:hypothetical protein